MTNPATSQGAIAPTPDLAEALRSHDGRQSEAALAIARGTQRLLIALGLASLPELSLANGRRADLAGVSNSGELWIVEIKSSIEDFRADQKWPEYRDYCDRFWFAVSPQFPREILPAETGIIVADRYAGEIMREAPVQRLPAARRKAVTLLLARSASLRLQGLADPGLAQQNSQMWRDV